MALQSKTVGYVPKIKCIIQEKSCSMHNPGEKLFYLSTGFSIPTRVCAQRRDRLHIFLMWEWSYDINCIRDWHMYCLLETRNFVLAFQTESTVTQPCGPYPLVRLLSWLQSQTAEFLFFHVHPYVMKGNFCKKYFASGKKKKNWS